jgi:hypothetical protein
MGALRDDLPRARRDHSDLVEAEGDSAALNPRFRVSGSAIPTRVSPRKTSPRLTPCIRCSRLETSIEWSLRCWAEIDTGATIDRGRTLVNVGCGSQSYHPASWAASM